MSKTLQPGLYIVGTPIGNIEDITLRALDTLKQAQLIIAEDTRVTRNLLNHYQISKPVKSYREAMSQLAFQRIASEVIATIQANAAVALVTDAGTPGIADPAGKMVAEVFDAGLLVYPIPGVSALTGLLSVSGLPLEKVLFQGFLPKKKGRQTALQQIAEDLLLKRYDGVVLFESPHRIIKLLSELESADLQVIVGRELTKHFEEILRGSVKQVKEILLNRQSIKGEIVLILHNLG